MADGHNNADKTWVADGHNNTDKTWVVDAQDYLVWEHQWHNNCVWKYPFSETLRTERSTNHARIYGFHKPPQKTTATKSAPQALSDQDKLEFSSTLTQPWTLSPKQDPPPPPINPEEKQQQKHHHTDKGNSSSVFVFSKVCILKQYKPDRDH